MQNPLYQLSSQNYNLVIPNMTKHGHPIYGYDAVRMKG
jgi:hypothetical protein